MSMPDYESVIIGTGFGGLCMAYHLKKAQRHDFLMLEKAETLGGTWRENTYPGAKCDTYSAIYEFTFARNPDWDYRVSRQAQIFQYQKDVARDFDLLRHMQFNTKVLGATYDESAKTWTVKTDKGEITCRYLISSVGQLHHPKMPAIKGVESFKGASFHSAQWNHNVDLTGKKVGIVGSAASAIQVIAEVAKIAGELTIYQRTPNWVINNRDKAYSDGQKKRARKVPFLRKIERAIMMTLSEIILYPAVAGSKFWGKALEAEALKNMKKHIQDPKLQEVLTPDYPIGAKRVLLSTDFYPAIARDNVDIETKGIKGVNKNGIECADGTQNDHDVIVYATGFYTNPFLMGLDIKGRGGATLEDRWADGAYAYNTVTTANFPNLFYMYGPNSNTGHTAITLKHEAQAGYITQLIEQADGGEIEVKEEVENAFVDEMQKRLSEFSWAKVEKSWYKQGDKIPNNWCGNLKEYQRRLAKPDWSNFKPLA